MTRDQAEAVEQTDETTATENPSKGTLDVSLDDAFNAGAASSVRRRISSGTLLMGLVVVVAGVSLWSMRAIDRAAASGPKVRKDLDVLFNDALAKGKSPSEAQTTSATILLSNADPASEMKVPLKDLAKNPFVIWRDTTEPPPETTPQGEPQTTPRIELIRAWEQQVDSAAAAIKVQSTMVSREGDGSSGIANIGGHMMRPGDLFAVENSVIEFYIDRIDRNEVTVRAVNKELNHARVVIVKVNRKW